MTVENREPDVGCAAEIDTDWGWREHKRMDTKCLGAAVLSAGSQTNTKKRAHWISGQLCVVSRLLSEAAGLTSPPAMIVMRVSCPMCNLQ